MPSSSPYDAYIAMSMFRKCFMHAYIYVICVCNCMYVNNFVSKNNHQFNIYTGPTNVIACTYQANNGLFKLNVQWEVCINK